LNEKVEDMVGERKQFIVCGDDGSVEVGEIGKHG